MVSLNSFQNSKLAVKFSYTNYDFQAWYLESICMSKNNVVSWPPLSSPSPRKKLRYRRDNKSVLFNRLCCQSATSFDQLRSVFHAKHEGCVSDVTVNVSALRDPNSCKGLGIVDFMKGKNFLITGATGFVAKVLVEKILRMQPDTGKLFLIIRADDPASALKRLRNQIMNAELFKGLREMYGNEYEKFMLEKLVPVPGDVTQPNLGIQEEIADLLVKEVDIIVSSAAVTTFDERYDFLMQTNTLGVYRLLEFGKRCQKIQLFMQLSTAYVNGQSEGRALEKPFRTGHNKNPRLDVEAEFQLADKVRRDLENEFSKFRNCNKGLVSWEKISQRLKDLGTQRAREYGWHDTYAFTKAMAEMLIVDGRKHLPVLIVRPSVIESTYSQPFPGWIEGNRMLDPLIANYGKGQVSYFLADADTVVDLIPADMVVNATLAAMAKHAGKPGVEIYHVASSIANPITLGNLAKLVFEHFKHNPYIDKKGEPIRLVKELTYLPAEEDFYRALDMDFKSPGIPRLATDQLKYMAKIYKPYAFYKARFDISNLEKLLQELSKEEQENFRFDVKNIEWNDYIGNVHIPGLRQHVMRGRGTGKLHVKNPYKDIKQLIV